MCTGLLNRRVPRVLEFAAVTMVETAILFGIAPAFQATGVAPMETLKAHCWCRWPDPGACDPSVAAALNGRNFDQICALPPSTKSSMPVTKLESSEARNSAALAISSGSPIRPIGTVDAILAIASGGS
jgi:hypothetical protein